MSESKIIDLNEKKKEIVEIKRREFERILFKQLLGVYGFLEGNTQAISIQLIDLSPKGMLIQIPKKFITEFENKINEEILLRLYFSPHSYLPVQAFIKYINDYQEKTGLEYLRIGLEINTLPPSYKTLEHFIHFIYDYASTSISDKNKAHVI